MNSENKYYQTGSAPFYLNVNNTAKEYSINQTSSPENELIDLLCRYILIIDESIQIDTTDTNNIPAKIDCNPHL